MKIANLTLKNPFILAPMLDITNLPFRLLCRKAGAALAYTEMFYTNQLLHPNTKTKQMLQTSPKDSPVGIQITGSSLKEFKKLIPFLKKSKFDLIDLNCGCPATRIIGTKAGSYLLKDPKKIHEIIKILKTSGKPITAKIRLGFNKNNVLEIAKAIEKAGADAITLHPRKSNDSYSTPADHSQTKKIKSNLKIPVIANGDIFTKKDADTLLEFTDAIMIGRAAIGNPLIFKQLLTNYQPSFQDKIKQFDQYISLCKKHKISNLQQIKHIGTHFLKRFPQASQKRNQLMQLKSLKEIQSFIKTLK